MTVDGATPPPKVSVIIPHYRDLKGLAVCLAALDRQTYPRDRFEIVVADNASPEGLEPIAEVVAGRARLILAPEKGAGPARNDGVAASTGEILAFIDSDCVAEPAWLAEGVKALAAFDFVGGRVKVLVEDTANVTPAEAFERVFAFDFKTYIERKKFTGAGNLLCPRRLFEAVGGFRAAVSEDVEWSRRAQANGFTLGYAPLAVVGHPARRSWSELQAKWRRVNQETFLLTAQTTKGRVRWLVKALMMPASAVAHTAKVLRSAELDTPGQKWDAIRVLYRLRMWRLADSLRLLMRNA